MGAVRYHKPSDFVLGFLAWLAIGGLLAGSFSCTTNSGPVEHSDPAWIFAKEGVAK